MTVQIIQNTTVEETPSPSAETTMMKVLESTPTGADSMKASDTTCCTAASVSEEPPVAVEPEAVLNLDTPPSSPPDEMEEEIARYLHSRIAGSPFFQNNPSAALPVLDIDGKCVVGSVFIVLRIDYSENMWNHRN
jgi:hypothetical protein